MAVETCTDNWKPRWYSRISNIKNRDFNMIKSYDKQFKYSEKEIGMRHSGNESHMKIFDNGDVDIFAGNTTGIRISDEYDTVNMYGNAININAQKINFRTDPDGLIINGYAINPQLYLFTNDDINLTDNADLAIECTVRYWDEANDHHPGRWARKSISIKPFKKVAIDNEYDELLKELGIIR